MLPAVSPPTLIDNVASQNTVTTPRCSEMLKTAVHQALEDPFQPGLPARALQELIQQCIPVRPLASPHDQLRGGSSADDFCLAPLVKKPTFERLVSLLVCARQLEAVPREQQQQADRAHTSNPMSSIPTSALVAYRSSVPIKSSSPPSPAPQPSRNDIISPALPHQLYVLVLGASPWEPTPTVYDPFLAAQQLTQLVLLNGSPGGPGLLGLALDLGMQEHLPVALPTLHPQSPLLPLSAAEGAGICKSSGSGQVCSVISDSGNSGKSSSSSNSESCSTSSSEKYAISSHSDKRSSSSTSVPRQPRSYQYSRSSPGGVHTRLSVCDTSSLEVCAWSPTMPGVTAAQLAAVCVADPGVCLALGPLLPSMLSQVRFER
jgi:hypothetical protein